MRSLARRVIAAVAILTIIRLVFAPMAELLPEEAYYWMYSKHPALGYFDHPPMVAWIVALGTMFFGDTELGVRIVVIVLSAASCGLMFLTGRLWFGRRAALKATLFYTLLPVYAAAGFLLTPDQPLIFFWLLALYGFSKALRTGRWRYWLLGGIGCGGALLSKYYALLLGPSLLLFLVTSRQNRHWILRPQPWVAFGLALSIFSPVIFWNFNHQWTSFLFQATRTSNLHPQSLRYFLEFWLVQVGIVTPLVFALLVFTAFVGIRRVWHGDAEHWNFALSFSLPLFFLFVIASMKTEVHVNWTAPAFLSLLPGAASVLDSLTGTASHSSPGWARIGMQFSLALCVISLVSGLSGLTWGIPPLYKQAGGWRRLALATESSEQAFANAAGRDPFVLDTGKYILASEVGFYTHQPEEQLNNYALGQGGLAFQYWAKLDSLKGAPALALIERKDMGVIQVLRAHFDRIDSPEEIEVHGPGWHRRKIFSIRCYGYRGPN